MKKFAAALAFLAFLSSVSFSQASSRDDVNQNARRENRAAQAVETAPPTLGVTVEKYVTGYDVNSDGTAVRTWEMQQRFDSELVVERFKKFERAFNGELQKAEVLDAFIVKADGSKRLLAADAVRIKPTPQAEAAPAFSSYRQIEIDYGALEKGDATYFKIRLTTLKPHFDGQFDFLEVFPLGYNWQSIEVNLSAPPDFPLSVQAVDLNGGRLPDENGRARWQWRQADLKAFAIEPSLNTKKIEPSDRPIVAANAQNVPSNAV